MSQSPLPYKVATGESFTNIIPGLLEGKSYARIAWQADEPETKIFMKSTQDNKLLYILRGGKEHTLIVGDGDLTATDWIIV